MYIRAFFSPVTCPSKPLLPIPAISVPIVPPPVPLAVPVRHLPRAARTPAQNGPHQTSSRLLRTRDNISHRNKVRAKRTRKRRPTWQIKLEDDAKCRAMPSAKDFSTQLT